MATLTDRRFAWTEFYAEVADKLLQYRYDRTPLVEAIADIARRRPELPFAINDQFQDGSVGPLRDICPFTTMGLFNRSLTDANRRAIAAEFAQFLNVKGPLPRFSTNDDGIPLLNNQNSWFFQYAKDRKHDAIDTLWEVFASALSFADGDPSVDTEVLVSAYDRAQSQPFVAFNLTIGFYWVRPWWYLPLDGNSRAYIERQLSILLARTAPSGAEYVALCDRLAEQFEDHSFPVHSFPELSWAAYQPDRPAQVQRPSDTPPQTQPEPEPPVHAPQSPATYTIDNIVADGCFLPRAKLETMLQRLQTKQNLILQGPPGTGKTWLAKKLTYAFIGRKDDSRVRPMQFHPNLSYEDFVRGWRPQGNGQLALVDGPFLQVVEEAGNNVGNVYVMVIEEINRGNPASIFGEMLTLLEADKRKPEEALALAYPREPGERVHIPPNVYVIGTMNLADRSLAMVDLALRRRLAFFDLEPMLNDSWREWVQKQCGIDGALLADIAWRINSLNDEIASDRNLGRQFRIGHSFVTPAPGASVDDPDAWFAQVMETEIVPLLREYWFDDSKKVDDAMSELLSDLA